MEAGINSGDMSLCFFLLLCTNPGKFPSDLCFTLGLKFVNKHGKGTAPLKSHVVSLKGFPCMAEVCGEVLQGDQVFYSIFLKLNEMQGKKGSDQI